MSLSEVEQSFIKKYHAYLKTDLGPEATPMTVVALTPRADLRQTWCCPLDDRSYAANGISLTLYSLSMKVRRWSMD